MRRSFAIFMAVVFSTLLILPAFAQPAKQALPFCCRKDGRHHCALRDDSSRVSGYSLRSSDGRCRYGFQCTAAAHIEPFGAIDNQAVYSDFTSLALISPQTISGFLYSPGRAQPKRGPPRLS